MLINELFILEPSFIFFFANTKALTIRKGLNLVYPFITQNFPSYQQHNCKLSYIRFRSFGNAR